MCRCAVVLHKEMLLLSLRILPRSNGLLQYFFCSLLLGGGCLPRIFGDFPKIADGDNLGIEVVGFEGELSSLLVVKSFLKVFVLMRLA